MKHHEYEQKLIAYKKQLILNRQPNSKGAQANLKSNSDHF